MFSFFMRPYCIVTEVIVFTEYLKMILLQMNNCSSTTLYIHTYILSFKRSVKWKPRADVDLYKLKL